MSAAQMSRLYDIIRDIDYAERNGLVTQVRSLAARSVLNAVLKMKSRNWASFYISLYYQYSLVDFINQTANGYLNNSLKINV